MDKLVERSTQPLTRCWQTGYYLVCSDRSEFDTETWCEGKHPIYYVALIPEGYDCDREYHFMTTNDKWFWASPYAE